MKNLQLIALALVCSVGTSAVAISNMISLKNNNRDMKYERAVAEVKFIPASHAFRIHTGYVELAPITKSGSLLQATERPCKYQAYKHGYKPIDNSCGSMVLAKHYNNDAKNVKAIFIRKIQAGKFTDYYRFQPGTSDHKRPRGGFAHQKNGMNGTMARSFVINNQYIQEAQ
jgi:hypothetical protein